MNGRNSEELFVWLAIAGFVIAAAYFALKSFADPLGLSVRAVIYFVAGVLVTVAIWFWRAINDEAIAAAALVPLGIAFSCWRAIDEWAGVYSESFFSQHIAWYGNGYIQFAVFVVLGVGGIAYYWKNKSWDFYL